MARGRGYQQVVKNYHEMLDLRPKDAPKAGKPFWGEVETSDPSSYPLERAHLTLRTFNCLRNLGVVNMGDVTQYSLIDILRVRNAGARVLAEVLHWCKLHQIRPILSKDGYGRFEPVVLQAMKILTKE